MKAKKIISQKTVKNFGVKKDTLLTIRHDDFGAILEDISGKFSAIVEGQNILTERVDKLDVRMGRVETKVDNLETKVDNLETKVDGLDAKVDNLEINMNSKFKTVFDYLSRIDDELQDIKKEMERLALTKADKTEIKELSYRVSNLERELAEVRRSVKV
jgi:chromosome segregation ATPase